MPSFKAMLGLGLFAGLAACQQMPQLPSVAGITTTTPGTLTEDTCGAAELQNLVGQPVSALNAAELPEGRRILFPGMAATQDFVPGRLNVEVGPEDQVTRVYCGEAGVVARGGPARFSFP
jgi:Peptidase inhibitor I78 family